MQYLISNTDELMDFIKREDITTDQALEIVCRALNVLSCEKYTKDKLIEVTETFIENYCKNGEKDKPIFLEPLLSLSLIDDETLERMATLTKPI
jgi:hypothetical protein